MKICKMAGYERQMKCLSVWEKWQWERRNRKLIVKELGGERDLSRVMSGRTADALINGVAVLGPPPFVVTCDTSSLYALFAGKFIRAENL